MASGSIDEMYLSENPTQRRRAQELTSVTMDGNVFNDGRTNCLRNIVTRQGDIWYPIAIRVRQPENFELEHIDIEVGGSIIQRFDKYFFFHRDDLVSHRDNQCVIRFPVKEY
jgi:hypothetical protein